MLDDAILKRFIAATPLTVMVRTALERALDPEWIDDLFQEQRERQYTRELLFSTVVELTSSVALGIQPSVHAAARARKSLPVSLPALYGKLQRTEPRLMGALVRGSFERLLPVARELGTAEKEWLAGVRIRIVDGNHLPASEKRLKPLRGFRGAALPGHSLVVYDAELDLQRRSLTLTESTVLEPSKKVAGADTEHGISNCLAKAFVSALSEAA